MPRIIEREIIMDNYYFDLQSYEDPYTPGINTYDCIKPYICDFVFLNGNKSLNPQTKRSSI